MARKLDATAYDKLKDRLTNTDWNILNNMNVKGGFLVVLRISSILLPLAGLSQSLI